MSTLRVTILGSIILLVLSTCIAAGTHPTYAEDRAAIEDLQARYMFALDFKDAAAYAATFTKDGILDYGRGAITGREAILALIAGMRTNWEAEVAADTSGVRPAAGRHSIANIVIRIEGDRAFGRAYWFHMSNDSADRTQARLTSFGHYEDELERVDGRWLFKKRKIYNEIVPEWVGPTTNPSW